MTTDLSFFLSICFITTFLINFFSCWLQRVLIKIGWDSSSAWLVKGNVMQYLIRFHMFERFKQVIKTMFCLQSFCAMLFYATFEETIWSWEFRFRCSFFRLFFSKCNLPNAAISNHFSAFNELCSLKERFYAIFCATAAVLSFNWMTQMHLSGL